MRLPDRENLSRLGSRLDAILAPGLPRPVEEIEDVDRMDWELWLLVILVVMLLTIAILLNHFPDLIGVTEYIPQPAELQTYLDGFAILMLVFIMYVIQKHRQLMVTRRNLIFARMARFGLENRLDLVGTLFGLSTRVTSRLAQRTDYGDVITHLVEVIGVDHGSLWLSSEPGGGLELDSQGGIVLYPAGAHVAYGEGILGEVARDARPVIIGGDGEGGRLASFGSGGASTSSAICVPLVYHADLIGVLLLTRGASRDEFTEADRQVLQVFTSLLAAAHRATTLVKDLRQSLDKIERTQIHMLQAEKLAALGELMAGISHELNNPLSVVLGQSELLLDGEVPGDTRRRLETVVAEAKRAKRLVENLLRVTRGDEPYRESHRLDEVVWRALGMLRYQLEQDGVEVSEEHDEDQPEVILDEFGIQQLVFNLVNNARQAMSESAGKRLLTVRTYVSSSAPEKGERLSPALHLEVCDTGKGIAEEDLNRVFEPFFTTKKVGEGTGLGLSICYRVVQDHGGRITVSNIEGGGAKFDVWLPLEQTSGKRVQAAQSAKESEEEPAKAGARVLVIDDESRVRDLIEEALGLAGYVVEHASNGAEGLEMLASGPDPDAIILDLKMPVMSGQEFFRRIEDDHPALRARVLFLTGDTLSKDARSFLEGSGRPFMGKPFSLRELRSAIARILREA